MRHLLRWGSSTLVIAALLVPSHTVHAQRAAGQFQITPRLGYVAWDNASGIQDPVLNSGDCDYPQFGQECARGTNNLMAGISALYGLTNNLSLGVGFDVARPVTNGTFFSAAEIEIAGLQELTLINQRLTVIQYTAEGQFAFAVGRIAPFVVGSVGGYTVYKEASKSDFAGTTGFERFGDLMFSVGLGLDFLLAAGSGFRIEVRDLVYTGWDRAQLNPVRPEFQTELFPDLLPAAPGESDTLHNFMLAIGFVFVPGGAR